MRTQKLYTVNIGLENCPFTVERIIENLMRWNGVNILKHKVVMGEYNGKEEQTLVLTIERTTARVSKILEFWENKASALNQDCIAVSMYEIDALAYSPRFDGKRQKFDINYFIF